MIVLQGDGAQRYIHEIDRRQRQRWKRDRDKLGRAIDIKHATDITTKLLNIINGHLADKKWLVADKLSIADIAIYPYLALAHEGQIDISPYQNITEWLARFEALPDYVSMPGINL